MSVPLSELGYKGTLTIGSEAQYVKDVTVDMGRSEIDDTTRACEGWQGRRTGLGNWSVAFELVRKQGDTVFTNVQSAYYNNTVLSSVSVTDEFGDTISGDVNVSQFTRNEPLDGVVSYNVALLGNGKPDFS